MVFSPALNDLSYGGKNEVEGHRIQIGGAPAHCHCGPLSLSLCVSDKDEQCLFFRVVPHVGSEVGPSSKSNMWS